MKATKVALVTGGGTGIGRAIAQALAREGVAVGIGYSKSKAEAEATAAEIQKLNGRAIALHADVTKDVQVRAMVDRVAGEFGGLDFLVNNAGWTHFVPFQDMEGLSDSDWDRCMAINVKGPFYCARAATPHMRQRGGGAIINIASVAGVTGQGSSIAYCASKAAMICLTKLLAKALAPEIRVNAVAPGVVLTRWVEGQESFVRAARGKTPLQRNATPEDIAAVAVPLLLRAEFVTGQTVHVDGGVTY